MGNPPHITGRGGHLRAIKQRYFRRYLPDPKRNPLTEVTQLGIARKTVVEFVLMRQKMFDMSLRKAILNFQERMLISHLPPHIKQAAIYANARPSQISSLCISSKTLFRWVQLYKMGGDTALMPCRSLAYGCGTRAGQDINVAKTREYRRGTAKCP